MNRTCCFIAIVWGASLATPVAPVTADEPARSVVARGIDAPLGLSQDESLLYRREPSGVPALPFTAFAARQEEAARRQRELIVMQLRETGGGRREPETTTPAEGTAPAETTTEGDAPQSPDARPAPPAIEWDDHFTPMPNRWFIEPPPYDEVNDEKSPWNPYQRNRFKGDYPIIGEDIFLNLTATDFLLLEGRAVPTPTGISGPSAGKEDFFGDQEQFVFVNNLIFEADLFKGQQAFKPVDWRIKTALVYNTTYASVGEVGAVNINVDKGDDRWSDYLSLQEAFVEYHLGDLTDRYDFISAEAGILAFRSDFRGFVFEDSNLGARIFGNAENNKWQYNLVVFDTLEKDTNSELNRFDDRDQVVAIANLYRQDLFFLGYNTSVSFHFNHDDDSVHFNRNGFLVRPKPAGLATPHEVTSYYLGWVGDGHIGPINLTHAFYQVFGEEESNEFAARDVDINAQLAALELSYDIDWLRPRIFALYQSGDDDTRDGKAEGFDGINEAPNFAGGEASFFNRQDIRLLGVGLTQRLSPYVDLSTSKLEGQSNFVNPGLLLIGGAFDFEITPTCRAEIGVSYLRFVETDPLEVFLEVEDIDDEIGTEIFFEIQYRPFLTNNIIFNLGFSPFFPGDGFAKIYQSREVLFSTFLDTIFTW